MSGDFRAPLIEALTLGLESASNTTIYRWPQQQDVPVIADIVLAEMREAGWVFVECDCGEEGRPPRLHWHTCPTYETWAR